jgi:hypothetical protein
MNDPLLTLLDGLPSATLDPARADRIRVRCRAALGRKQRRAPGATPTRRGWPSIVMGLGGLYLGMVLQRVLALYGLV